MRNSIDLYNILPDPDALAAALTELRAEFDSHNHDGVNSKFFETLNVETLSARAISIRKSSYTDTTAGFWAGLVDNVQKVYIGDASNYMKWTGSALQIAGQITAGSGSLIENFYIYNTYVAGETIAIGDSVYQMYIEGTGTGTPPQTVNRPTSTNDLWQATPASNYKDMSSVTIGGYSTDSTVKCAIMIFNISSLPATAEKVLFHFKSNTLTITGSETVTVSKITSSYNPATVTWNDKPTAGGTYGSVAVTANNTYYSIDITTLYNEWKAGNNYGMYLSGDDAGGGQYLSIWGYYGGSGGDSMYLEVWGPAPSNGGKIYKAKSDIGYTCGTFVGIAVSAGNAGDSIKVQTTGIVPNSILHEVPSNGAVYISETSAGHIQSTAPTDFPMVIGEQISGNGLTLFPRRVIRKSLGANGKFATGFKPIVAIITDPTAAAPTVTYNAGSIIPTVAGEYGIFG